MATRTAPTGRPSKIDQVVHTRPDGTTVTAGQQVIERVRLGLEYQGAADTAGVSRATLSTWRLTGARARAKTVKGERCNAAERRAMAFLDDLERAQHEAHLERLAVIARAQQPFHAVKVVERTQPLFDPTTGAPVLGADGRQVEVVIERTTTRETKPPQWTPAAWWLERRLPHLYSKRVELSGPDGGPIPMEQRAADLGASLEAYLAGAADAAEQGAAAT